MEEQATARYGDDEMLRLGQTIAERIATRQVRPTGIVALNDMMATGLILGFQNHGLRVPDDISVVGRLAHLCFHPAGNLFDSPADE